MNAATRGSQDAQRVAVVALMLAAAGAALWPAVASMAGNWARIHDYQHGFLIAPVALVWLAVAGWRLHDERPRPLPAALAPLSIALVLWLVAFRAHSNIAMEALFPPIAWLAVCAGAGWRIARAVAAPLAWLYFAIPVWEFLLPALQWLSVQVTEALLALAGIPAEVDEYLVTLPAGSFEIVEGCSGKRFFVVALAVAVLAGVLRRLHGWRLAALVAAAGALALIANWLRIFVVIAAGHATHMQHYLVAVEHQTFGNVVFAILLVAIYFTAVIAARGAEPRLSPQSGPALPASGAGDRLSPAVALPLLLLGAVAAAVQLPAQAAQGASRLGSLPVAAGVWQGPMPAAAHWSPVFAGPDFEQRASYRRGQGDSVQLYLNLYRSQEPGRELVYFRNSLLAPGPWSRAWPQRLEVLDIAEAPALATIEVSSPTGQRWLLAYVYKVGGWTTLRAPLAQAGYGLLSLLRPVPSGIISMSVQCRQNCQDARALVRDFWQELSSPILGMIPDHAA